MIYIKIKSVGMLALCLISTLCCLAPRYKPWSLLTAQFTYFFLATPWNVKFITTVPFFFG